MIYGIISQQDNKCKPLVTKKTQNLGFTKFWACKVHPRAVFLNKILHGALNYALYTEEILKFLRCIFYDSKKILQNQNYVFDRKIDRWMGINGVESLKPDIFEDAAVGSGLPVHFRTASRAEFDHCKAQAAQASAGNVYPPGIAGSG